MSKTRDSFSLLLLAFPRLPRQLRDVERRFPESDEPDLHYSAALCHKAPMIFQ